MGKNTTLSSSETIVPMSLYRKRSPALRCENTVSANYSNSCPIQHLSQTQGKAQAARKSRYYPHDAPRDTDFFKETHNLRITVEQYFSRLGDLEAEQTTHYKLRIVQNQMAITHLSVSLVASDAALLLKQPTKSIPGQAIPYSTVLQSFIPYRQKQFCRSLNITMYSSIENNCFQVFNPTDFDFNYFPIYCK